MTELEAASQLVVDLHKAFGRFFIPLIGHKYRLDGDQRPNAAANGRVPTVGAIEPAESANKQGVQPSREHSAGLLLSFDDAAALQS